MQERLDWIDAVKGACLLLVMIAHLWRPCPYWVHVLTGGYMLVFFVMAGITSVGTKRSFNEQIRNKAKRLLVPYAVYGVILILLGMILPTQAQVEKGLLGLLYGRYSLLSPTIEPHFPLLQACGYLAPFWFLPCIFLSYVLLAWYDHSHYPYLIVVLAILVGILTPLCPVLLPWCIEMSFIGFLVMLSGRMLRPILMTIPFALDKTAVLQLLLWSVCGALYLVTWKIDGPTNMSLSQMGNEEVFFPLRFVFFGLLGISEAVFLSLSFRTINATILTSFFAYVGRQALRLMCIHLFIGQGVFYVLSKADCPMAVSFACAIGVIFFVNWILDYSLQWISRKKATCNIPAEEH